MSIRHIVMWKLVATDPAGRAEATAEIRRSLESLPEKLTGLVFSLKIFANVVNIETNWDVVLDSEFATLEDLEAYRAHPLHVEMANHVKPLIALRSAIDIDIDI